MAFLQFLVVFYAVLDGVGVGRPMLYTLPQILWFIPRVFFLLRSSSSYGTHSMPTPLHPCFIRPFPVFIARFRMRTFGHEVGEGCCAGPRAISSPEVLLPLLTSLDISEDLLLRPSTNEKTSIPCIPVIGSFCSSWSFALPCLILCPIYTSCLPCLGQLAEHLSCLSSCH